MVEKLRVGVVGCGVVGTGVVESFAQARLRNGEDWPFVIQRIAVRDVQRPRSAMVDARLVVGDWRLICEARDIDVVVEVIGGTDVASDVVETAIRHGKSVVTANKELISRDGDTIHALAAEKGVDLRYEASVLGGIPALHTLDTYFRVTEIDAIRGIVNGTSNFILTQMHQDEVPFAEALRDAQRLGYAEPNPDMDVDGLDAWFKLQILLQTLGISKSQIECTGVKGIRDVRIEDMMTARSRGNKLKHLVTATRNPVNGQVTCEVGPVELAPSDSLYHVDGVQNALMLRSERVGDITLVGPGAGAYPTASAVLEDLAKIAWRIRENGVEYRQKQVMGIR